MNNFKEDEERMNDRQIFHSTIQEFHISDLSTGQKVIDI